MNMNSIGQIKVGKMEATVTMVQDKLGEYFPVGRQQGFVTRWCPEAICA